jgi:flagellar biosynthesis protein
MAETPRSMRRAVALRYDAPRDKAPVVVAKGQGTMAERIIELARSNHVPIHEDRNLVQVLSALDIDKQVPPEAYQAIAAILAFLYRLNRQASAERRRFHSCYRQSSAGDR